MDKNKPIDKLTMDTLDNISRHAKKPIVETVDKTIDKFIHSKPKPDETQKDFLKRKGVIRY